MGAADSPEIEGLGGWEVGRTDRGSPAEVSLHPGLLQKNMEAPPHPHVGQNRGSKCRHRHMVRPKREGERERERERA